MTNSELLSLLKQIDYLLYKVNKQATDYQKKYYNISVSSGVSGGKNGDVSECVFSRFAIVYNDKEYVEGVNSAGKIHLELPEEESV